MVYIIKQGTNVLIDYALLTLNGFDYYHAHVKKLFGGLKFSVNNPAVGDAIYVSQFSHSDSMQISATKNNDYCCIIELVKGSSFIRYNADTEPSSSGSPVISRDTHELVTLNKGNDNYYPAGVPSQILNDEIGAILGKDNVAVKGERKVTSFNFEVKPFTHAIIHVNISEHCRIKPFDTVILEDFDQYSIIEVEALNLASSEITNIKFKVEVE
ncbi:MAG TPA: hypothetical protein ACHBX0_02380 [Arsenophonus sp.]